MRLLLWCLLLNDKSKCNLIEARLYGQSEGNRKKNDRPSDTPEVHDTHTDTHVGIHELFKT